MIFLILGQVAEKAFVKLQDQYVRAKKELKKNSRSFFLSWFDNSAIPRPTRSNFGDISDEEATDIKNNLNFTQSDGESDKDLSPR